MPRTTPRVFLATMLAAFFLLTLSFFHQPSPPSPAVRAPGHVDPTPVQARVSDEMLGGGVVMPHLGNATAKAELGRATWKFLHTMMARFPDKPTAEQQESLRAFMHLFSRLYPCGECAEHFQQMLQKYPPQTGSRSSAAAWLCSLHNNVNKRLHKPVFDCTKIGDFYDCGCGPDKEPKIDKAAGPLGSRAGAGGSAADKIEVHPEPLTNG